MAAQHGAEAIIRSALNPTAASEMPRDNVALLSEYFPHVEHCINATDEIDGPGSFVSLGETRCALCGVPGEGLIVDQGYGGPQDLQAQRAGELRNDTVAIHPGCALLEVARMTAMWCFHLDGDTEGVVIFRVPIRHPSMPLSDEVLEGLIVTTDKRLGTHRLIHRVDFLLADDGGWDTDIHIDMAEVDKVYQRSVLRGSDGHDKEE